MHGLTKNLLDASMAWANYNGGRAALIVHSVEVYASVNSGPHGAE